MRDHTYERVSSGMVAFTRFTTFGRANEPTDRDLRFLSLPLNERPSQAEGKKREKGDERRMLDVLWRVSSKANVFESRKGRGEGGTS